MAKYSFRKLKFHEFTKLYYNDMMRDFPKDEIRPFWTIAKLLLKKQYACMSLWKQEKLIAYATLLRSNTSSCVLLDYFAVVPSERNGGYGGKILKKLQQSSIDGILLETEMPEKAVDEEERALRERRIAFYERNGARRTNISTEVFGVPFHILYIPIQKDYSEQEILTEIEHIYKVALPKTMFEKYVQISTRE